MEDTELKFINPYKLFHGAFIPNWLLERKEISHGAKLTYAKLCQYAGKDGVCFPKQASIAQALGIEKRQTLVGYIKELKDNQLIIIIRIGSKCTNRYKFLYHLWMGYISQNGHHDVGKTDITDVGKTDIHSNRIKRRIYKRIKRHKRHVAGKKNLRLCCYKSFKISLNRNS